MGTRCCSGARSSKRRLRMARTTWDKAMAARTRIIASRGKFFVGTVKSHFSKEIHMERRARQGGGEAFYENSVSMSKGGELVPLCRSWQGNEGECEIGPLD